MTLVTSALEPPALVGGQLVMGLHRCEVRNPADVDEVVGTVASLQAADVDRAIEAAAAAQERWAATPAVERAAVLVEAADRIAAIDDLGSLITREQGKVAWEAGLEAGFFEAIASYYSELAPMLDEGRLIVEDDLGRLSQVQDPVGVVAAITPSNWPFALTALKLIPALLAGNGVIVKPAPTTPLAVLTACLAIADLFPAGLISVVTGDQVVVGQRILEHPLVRMVSFTGGTETGRMVARTCATTLKTVALELGGNDAALLLHDVEVDEGLLGNLVGAAFTTTGQICFAIKRLYVPRARREEVVDGLVATLDDLVIGDGMDPASSLGPLHSAAGRSRVERLVADAERRGGTVHRSGTMSGDPARGFFLQASIVTDLDHDAPLVREEQFGPALPVIVYDDLDDAIRQVNGTDFGLCSSVWTTDEELGSRVARRLQAGTTFVNNHGLFALDLHGPFGGVKHSGTGRELGVEGLLAYTESHVISTRHL